MSMRAALDDLKATDRRRRRARRVAVLGDMLELGPDERELPRSSSASRPARPASTCWSPSGRWRRRSPTDSTARPTRCDAEEAASSCPSCLAPGDVVLVKASRGVGLELVCRALGAREDDA